MITFYPKNIKALIYSRVELDLCQVLEMGKGSINVKKKKKNTHADEWCYTWEQHDSVEESMCECTWFVQSCNKVPLKNN